MSSLWIPLKSGSSASITARSDQPKSVGRSVTSGAPVTKSTQRTVNSAGKPTIKSSWSTGDEKSIQGNSSTKSKGKTALQTSENGNDLTVHPPSLRNLVEPTVGIHAYYHPHYPRQGALPTSLSPSTPAVSPSHNESCGSPSVEKSVPSVLRSMAHRLPRHRNIRHQRVGCSIQLENSYFLHQDILRRLHLSLSSKDRLLRLRPQRRRLPRQPTSRRLSTDKESPHKATISHKLAFLHQRQPWKG